MGRGDGKRRPGGGHRQRHRSRPRGPRRLRRRRPGTVDPHGRGRKHCRRPRAPPRSLRSRHRLRGDHPLPGSRGQDHQRAGPRAGPVREGGGLPAGPRLGHRAGLRRDQPVVGHHQAGLGAAVLRAVRRGVLPGLLAGDGGQQRGQAQLSLHVRHRDQRGLQPVAGPVPFPLQPRPSDRVPGPGHQRRRRLDRQHPSHGHRQLLRRPAHLRASGPDPLETPRAAAVPGEDRPVGDRGQRPPGPRRGAGPGPPEPGDAAGGDLGSGDRGPAPAGHERRLLPAEREGGGQRGQHRPDDQHHPRPPGDPGGGGEGSVQGVGQRGRG